MRLSVFKDSTEYTKRKNTPFTPPKVTWNELYAALPKRVFKKSTIKGLSYVVRDVALAVVLYKLSWRMDWIVACVSKPLNASGIQTRVIKWILWTFYFNAQGIVLTSWWCLAHEASHGTLSSISLVNDVVGFLLHTFLLAPYFAWKASHHTHHVSTASVERDENYVPPSRSQFNLQPDEIANAADYNEIFEETPIYNTLHMIAMQLLGLPFYFLFNLKGSPRHPPGTNHFHPHSSLFKPHERVGVIISDIGIAIMVCMLYNWTKQVGFSHFVCLYFVPFLLANHWIVMTTYLQHTDPTIPYYRQSHWTFVRGALATVDRPFLGWIGRTFFHNLCHDHISHHLFSSIPFYNLPIATECIKKVLKTDYNYDSSNSFRALYRTFIQCEFIEDEGGIVFYKNREGRANRVAAEMISEQ